MATKKASALKAFITGIVCIVMIGLGWLSDPLIANGEAGLLSRLLAWSCLAAAAIAQSWRSISLSERLRSASLKKSLISILKKTALINILSHIIEKVPTS